MKLTDIFHVFTGNKLDYGKQISDDNGINFVSRNSNNNGVVGRVLLSDNIIPYKKGDITVPLGGSYLLSCFVQQDPFITAQNVAVLRPIDPEMLDIEKWFYCHALEENRFKFSAFGREVNKYLKDMELPNEVPNWIYEKSLVPISTNNSPINEKLDTSTWKEFPLITIFDISAGIYHYAYEYSEGSIPYISATIKNNGVTSKVDLNADFSGNVITTEKIKCRAFYQPDNFCATSDVNVLKPKFEMNKYIALFITTIINFNENYRWNYGRQCRVGDTKKIKVKLPTIQINDGKWIPDFEYMESYIKKLPFGDMLKEI